MKVVLHEAEEDFKHAMVALESLLFEVFTTSNVYENKYKFLIGNGLETSLQADQRSRAMLENSEQSPSSNSSSTGVSSNDRQVDRIPLLNCRSFLRRRLDLCYH